jgi:UDP-N-acetylglucosamine 2-epimerase (non-hydrolysing)
MPEEVNRILTDSISDLLWTPSEDGNENLLKEGVAKERIQLVGNIMIDSLVRVLPKLDDVDLSEIVGSDISAGYVVVTLHRPSNVDSKESLEKVLSVLEEVSRNETIVFPVHPRTRNNMKKYDLWERLEGLGITILEPLSYINFIALVRKAKLLLTDSGGVQEETTFLNVPCLTLRPNTERPITITQGTNTLTTLERVLDEVDVVLAGSPRGECQIPLWEGETAGRIVEHLYQRFQL